MKKGYFIPLLIAVGLVFSFILFNQHVYNQKQSSPSEQIESYRGTLTGEYVCLPHTDQSGPQTLECALGMKTEAGEYYALDFGSDSQEIPTLKTGDKFTATGLITPIELLSTDHWQKYPVEGIFSVTDFVEKL